MVDWGLVKFPLLHEPIYSGEVLSISSDGEEEWRSPKRNQAEGSYSKKIAFKSIGGDGTGLATHLWVNGNPSKFLQGHNIFGSDDFVSLMFDVFKRIVESQGITPTLQEWHQVKTGDYEVVMLDINHSYTLNSINDVRSFIRALEFKAQTRHGRPINKSGTLYFGKTSERWALKMYCKADEINTGRGALPHEIKDKGLEHWVSNKLRIELRLLSKELKKRQILKANQLTADTINGLYNEYLGRIDMSEQILLTTDVVNQLPSKLRSTYTLWSEGHDLRRLMSDSTYKRHRKELKANGIDIALTPNKATRTKANNIIPLIQVVEAKPAVIPQWAFDQGLVHTSAKRYG